MRYLIEPLELNLHVSAAAVLGFHTRFSTQVEHVLKITKIVLAFEGYTKIQQTRRNQSKRGKRAKEEVLKQLHGQKGKNTLTYCQPIPPEVMLGRYEPVGLRRWKTLLVVLIR